jgi:hypothetical protein
MPIARVQSAGERHFKPQGRLGVGGCRAIFPDATRVARWEYLLMDREDPEKRIADLERQLAAPRTAREDRKRAREQRKRWLREARKRVKDEAEVDAAQMGPSLSLFVRRTLVMLQVLGIAVFIAGLVLPHKTSWIWIGGLALFLGGVVPMFAGAIADEYKAERKIEKGRWQEGTVTFRTIELGKQTEDGWYVDCEVELNPTGRISQVYEDVDSLHIHRVVIGATMRCLIDRTEEVAFRAFPYAKPDAPLTSDNRLVFREGKSPRFFATQIRTRWPDPPWPNS